MIWRKNRSSRPEQQDPDFDEIVYLHKRLDVARAVEAGQFPDGRTHWEMWGRAETRNAVNWLWREAHELGLSQAQYQALVLERNLHDIAGPGVLNWTDAVARRLEGFRPPRYVGRQGLLLRFDDGGLFDERLYRRVYGPNAPARSGILLYYHYLMIGKAMGFLPHLKIDADWYLKIYPDAAESVRSQTHASAFEHYIQVGASKGYSPSDDFDELWYQERYPEVRAEIAGGTVISAYESYMLLDRGQMRDPNPYFSEVAYRSSNPAVVAEIAAGRYRSGFDHFVRAANRRLAPGSYRPGGWLTKLHDRWRGTCAPSPTFAEEYYLANNPDIALAVKSGDLCCGAYHWVGAGIVEDLEARRPRPPSFSEMYYLRQYPDAAAAVSQGGCPSGYHHYLSYGHAEGRTAYFPDPEPKPLVYDFPSLSRRREALPDQPLISIIMPVYETDRALLEDCIDSVLQQIYPNWELCITDDGSSRPYIRAVLMRYSRLDPRIKVVFKDLNVGISAASNAALEASSGQWVALLDHDDRLSPDALLEVASVIAEDPQVDLIYSDEDKINVDGSRHYDRTYKPSWSPELLTSTMYIGHLTVYRRSVIASVGGFRSEFDETQDYELALRASEVVTRVRHIPKVLYHWRAVPTSSALVATNKPLSLARQRMALEATLLRRGAVGQVDMVAHGAWRVRYAPSLPHPLVSVVIPTAGRSHDIGSYSFDLVRNCVRSLIDSESYDNLEIVVVHNDDLDPRTQAWLEARPQVRLVSYTFERFNFCEKLNLGVASARGQYILLMNDDMEVITPRFIHDLVGLAERPGIGAVGATLLFPDGRLQHAGMIMTSGGPSHMLIGEHASVGRPHGYLHLTRDVFGVTGACMMVRRDIFDAVGGFDEEFGPIYNDTDFCMKITARGLRIVIDPGSKLYHFESLSKSGTENWERFSQMLLARWGSFKDPYLHPAYDPESVFFEFQRPSLESFTSTLRRRIATSPEKISDQPVRFSLVQTSYNTPLKFLKELEESVFAQTYTNFEWVIVENGSQSQETIRWFDEVSKDPRVTAIRLDQNQGIMGGCREGLRIATGDYIVPIDSDDFLTRDALAIMAEAIARHGRPAILYSDECKSNPQSMLFNPFHKPGWDPLLYMNICYTCHLGCVRRDVAIETGCYQDDEATWSHDWDTNWRIYRSGNEPVHVPEVTYAWRIHPGSTASLDTSDKPEGVRSQEHVLRQQLEASGWAAELDIVPNEYFPHTGVWRLKPRKSPDASVCVVVDIGGHSGADLAAFLTALLADTGEARICILTPPGAESPAPLSHLIGDIRRRSVTIAHDRVSALRAACEGGASIVAWLDRQTTGNRPGWLAETVALLRAFDDASLACGRVIGPDGRVLWAGGYFGINGFIDSPDAGISVTDSGYHGMALCQRSVDGVPSVHWVAEVGLLSAALSAVPDDAAPPIIATALALQARQAGRRTVYTPFDVVKTTFKVVRPAVPTPILLEALSTDVPETSRFYNTKLSVEYPYHWTPAYQVKTVVS